MLLISLPDKGNASNGICSLQHLPIGSMFHLLFLDSYWPTNTYISLLSMVLEGVGDAFGFGFFFYYASDKIRYSKKLLAVAYRF